MSFQHDPLFRRTFSHADQVEVFLRGILAPAEIATLDFSVLEQLPDSFISPSLEKSFADVVWRCGLRTPSSCKPISRTPASHSSTPSAIRETATLCILIEHKAQPAEFPYPQLLRYIAGIWERMHAQDGRIHPLLPILFHQGVQPHQFQPLGSWFATLPSWLLPLTPLFEYRLCDLAAMEPRRVPVQFPHPELQLEFTAMKWASEGLPSSVLLESIGRVPRSWPLRELQAFKTYIEKGDLTAEELDQMAEQRPDEERREFMTLKDRLIEIGLKQGIERGHTDTLLDNARKMKEHGIAAEVIAEITGFTPAEIAQL